MVAVWEALDCESVGARELEQILDEVSRRFGASPADSPAALARILADEGAHLRHPEVLEFDAQWRESKLAPSAANNLDFSSLGEATKSLLILEDLRVSLSAKDDQAALRELLEAVVESKEETRLRAASPVISAQERVEAQEISSWLEIWLRTPELFSAWLELRRMSPEFRERFVVR
jgi:hypothetical protein